MRKPACRDGLMDGNVRASDPKVGTGFGINPMLNKTIRVAALIPFDQPPLSRVSALSDRTESSDR